MEWQTSQWAFGAKNDVISTSMQRDSVASTSVRRNFTSFARWVCRTESDLSLRSLHRVIFLTYDTEFVLFLAVLENFVLPMAETDHTRR